MSSEVEEVENSKKIFYDPETGYSGINDLFRKSGFRIAQVEEWLTEQIVYSLHEPIRH